MEDADVEPMEEDFPQSPQAAKSRVSNETKEQILNVLKQQNFANARAAKLSQDDFLLLLSLFNEAGFHFA